MPKIKKQGESIKKSTKKSKKHSRVGKESSNEEDDKKFSSICRKQTEVARVLQLKCAMLLQGNLSYLEYTELREELCRLHALQETFVRQAAKYEKNSN